MRWEVRCGSLESKQCLVAWVVGLVGNLASLGGLRASGRTEHGLIGQSEGLNAQEQPHRPGNGPPLPPTFITTVANSRLRLWPSQCFFNNVSVPCGCVGTCLYMLYIGAVLVYCSSTWVGGTRDGRCSVRRSKCVAICSSRCVCLWSVAERVSQRTIRMRRTRPRTMTGHKRQQPTTTLLLSGTRTAGRRGATWQPMGSVSWYETKPCLCWSSLFLAEEWHSSILPCSNRVATHRALSESV